MPPPTFPGFAVRFGNADSCGIVWNDPSYRSLAMKPMFRSAVDEKRRFPLTDYSFQAPIGEWRGYSNEDDDRSKFRDFYSLSQEFLLISARERAKEMAVFAVIVVTAAWPVIYMVITVVRVLLKGRPLN